jgi:hypothetical protein
MRLIRDEESGKRGTRTITDAMGLKQIPELFSGDVCGVEDVSECTGLEE